MSAELEQTTLQLNGYDMNVYIDDSLIEQIWSDLKGQVDREQIYEVALQEAEIFKNAIITNYIAIFIRRRTYKRLREMLNGINL